MEIAERVRRFSPTVADEGNAPDAVGGKKLGRNKCGNHLHYRGYTGSIRFSEEDAVFHGKVMGLKALVSFEGDSVSTVTDDFYKAVDGYLEFWEVRRRPQTPDPFAAALQTPQAFPA